MFLYIFPLTIKEEKLIMEPLENVTSLKKKKKPLQRQPQCLIAWVSVLFVSVHVAPVYTVSRPAFLSAV